MKYLLLFLVSQFLLVRGGVIISYPSTIQTYTSGSLTLPTNTPWTSYLTFNQFNVANASLVSVYVLLAGVATSQINSTNNLATEAQGYSYNQFSLSLIAGCCSGKFSTTGGVNVYSVNFDLFAHESAWDPSPVSKTIQTFKTFNNLSPSETLYFTGNGTVSFIATSQSFTQTVTNEIPGVTRYSVTARNMIPPTSYLSGARIVYYYNNNNQRY
jgi:hypothetical protein